MKSLKQRAAWIMGMAMLIVASCPVLALAEEEEYVPALYDTAWALLPPVVAIGLALITKEVYSSLFIGIVVGGLLYSGFGFEGTFVHVLQDGIIMNLSDSYNVGILVFLVTLGIYDRRFRSIRTLGRHQDQDQNGSSAHHHSSRMPHLRRRLLQLSDRRFRNETYNREPQSFQG